MTEDCVGTGTIVQVDIPYCPQCEEKPYVRGCFHVFERQDGCATGELDFSGARIAI
jgi:hypothetical protein